MSVPLRILRLDLGGEAPLQDSLFAHGVEFPCGGKGRCRRCRVRVVEGSLPATAEELEILGPEAIAEGWRLGCHARARGRIALEIAQWETAILADESAFPFTPSEGLGIAVDVGTTTLVAQLLDLSTGQVLGVRTALNPQAVHGADIMTRVEFALSGGQGRLKRLIRAETGKMAANLAEGAPVRRIVLVGNTVMHHLFCGISVEPLSRCPFEPVRDGLEVFRPAHLGWNVAGEPCIRFLPCLGGFVGSDILAGILATRMHESDRLIALADLGTNGEIVAGNRDRIICASTAAGPAFEGGRIGMGMRAAAGAITAVQTDGRGFQCRVAGDTAPRGICGSGLVDAAASALELGLLLPNGRLANGRRELPVAHPVVLTQADIRELQLAKAATAAGIQIVLNQWSAADLDKLYLAGAFGNYLNRASARRIGLFDLALERVEPAGNTALLGAKIALFTGESYDELRRKVRHLPLAADPAFQEKYVEAMAFPPD